MRDCTQSLRQRLPLNRKGCGERWRHRGFARDCRNCPHIGVRPAGLEEGKRAGNQPLGDKFGDLLVAGKDQQLVSGEAELAEHRGIICRLLQIGCRENLPEQHRDRQALLG